MTQPSPSPAPRRLRTTPYARRLARERGIALDAVTGSGPGGRITGTDVSGFRAPEAAVGDPATPVPANLQTALSGAQAPQMQARAALARQPSGLSVTLHFGPVLDLLVQVAAPSVSHEDVVLKAAAVALTALGAEGEPALMLQSAKGAIRCSGLHHASLSGIAALRKGGGSEPGQATLAVSFLKRAGVRPVSARLEGDAPARLMLGFPGTDNLAECLLVFDPDRIEDDAGAEFLFLLKEGIETPLRLLV